MSEARAPSARSDLIGGVVWVAFGIAIVAGSLAMDRLEQSGATLYTAPGLVPGILGATIVLLGLGLVVRALRQGAVANLSTPWRLTPDQRIAARRAGLAAALAIAYTLVMLGRMPFAAATALFVFGFIVVFGVTGAKDQGPRRRVLVAAITAVATTAAVMLLFEQVFLVRLP